jgi:hypothetical protein
VTLAPNDGRRAERSAWRWRIALPVALVVIAAPCGVTPEATPAGFAYSVRVADRGLLAPDKRRLLEEDVRAALDLWAQTIEGAGVLDVEIEIVDRGRLGGMCPTHVEHDRRRGRTIWECCSVRELSTGVDCDPATPDIRVRLPIGDLNGFYWIDPAPRERRLGVPVGRVDLVSSLVHEIGHGLGFLGFTVGSPLTPSAPEMTRFDSFVVVRDGEPLFAGPNAIQAGRGQPIALCTPRTCHNRQFEHLRLPRSTTTSPWTLRHVMSGETPAPGVRFIFGPEELGIFRDLGLRVRD